MKTRPITIHAAKTQLSRLIARAAEGEEVIIARGNVPVAKLVAIRSRPPRRRFGAMRGKIKTTAAFFEPVPDSELDAWEK